MNKLELDIHKSHSLSPMTRTVIERKCWLVVFDVCGNAPADAEIVACATPELAAEVCELFAATKEERKAISVVLNGERHFEINHYEVEGYNFDTAYDVREGWAVDDRVITTLKQIVMSHRSGDIGFMANLFDCVDKTELADGVYEDDSEEDGDEDGEE